MARGGDVVRPAAVRGEYDAACVLSVAAIVGYVSTTTKATIKNSVLYRPKIPRAGNEVPVGIVDAAKIGEYQAGLTRWRFA